MHYEFDVRWLIGIVFAAGTLGVFIAAWLGRNQRESG
jgi:hypothetical protein